ncbi:MAG: nickel transport protein [Thermodesulfobacteriota bacterium]|nr:nickel transport protein [Thermodesulfobacteriota bacterium]
MTSERRIGRLKTGVAFWARGLRALMTIWVMAVLFNAGAAADVFAHKVNVFAYVEGESIMVDGYFSGRVKAQNCLIRVFDGSGNKLLEGKTDTKGLYSFTIKDLPFSHGGLKIVLEAEMGHRAEYSIGESEIPRRLYKGASQIEREETMAQAPQESVAPKEGVIQIAGATEPTPQSPEASAKAELIQSSISIPQPSLDEETLRRNVEASLDEKLAPIIKMLGSQEKILLEEKMRGPKLNEIIGGIGWIVGIIGIGAFFWGQKRASRN